MSNLTLQIFTYKGQVGALSDIENGTFLNDVKGSSQLGVVVASANVGISQEAKDLIKEKHRREGGSFAPLMITPSEKSNGSIGILGFGRHLLTDMDGIIAISRDCDLSVLENCQLIENNPEDTFIEFVDDLINEENM